jgi:hypothetical protein
MALFPIFENTGREPRARNMCLIGCWRPRISTAILVQCSISMYIHSGECVALQASKLFSGVIRITPSLLTSCLLNRQ